MIDFNSKSNKELEELVQQMLETHTNIKARLLHDYNNLEIIEKDYETVQRILLKRLK